MGDLGANYYRNTTCVLDWSTDLATKNTGYGKIYYR